MSKYKNLGDMLATLFVKLDKGTEDANSLLEALKTCHEICRLNHGGIVPTKLRDDMIRALEGHA